MIEIPPFLGESFPGFLYLVEAETGRILSANSLFHKLFPFFAVGKENPWGLVWEVLASQESEHWRALRSELEQGKNATNQSDFQITFYNQTFRGNEQVVAETKSSPKLFFGAFLEITKEREQSENLDFLLKDKEKCIALASKLTHDLNNSLQPILIFANLGKSYIENQNRERELKDTFDKILHSGLLARDQLHSYMKNLEFSNGDPSPEKKIEQAIENSKNIWDSIRNKKIWIVDDDPLTLESMYEMLAAQNVIATQFNSPLNAFLALSKEIPDLIITDWHMEELNGLDLIRRVHQKRRNVAAILFSGANLEMEKIDCLEIILRQKPIPVSEFYETVLLALGYF